MNRAGKPVHRVEFPLVWLMSFRYYRFAMLAKVFQRKCLLFMWATFVCFPSYSCVDDSPAKKEFLIKDTGYVCISGSDSMGIPATSSTLIKAVVVPCGDCETAYVKKECQYLLTGQELTVHSSAVGVPQDTEGKACPQVCQEAIATCDGPNFQPGSYIFRYGNEETTVSVPTSERVCFGETEIGATGN